VRPNVIDCHRRRGSRSKDLGDPCLLEGCNVLVGNRPASKDDDIVRAALTRAGVPVCVTLAGGYADPIADTVEINLETLRRFASPS